MKDVPWVHNASVTEADFYEDGSVAPIIIDKFDFMGEMATALPKNVWGNYGTYSWKNICDP